MYIAAATVSMEAKRTYRDVRLETTLLQPLAQETETAAMDGFGTRFNRLVESGTEAELHAATTLMRDPAAAGCCSPPNTADLLESLAGRMTGRTSRIRTVNGVPPDDARLLPPQEVERGTPSARLVQRAELRMATVHRVSEEVVYAASGSVTMVDGSALDFTLDLRLKRSASVVNTVSLGTVSMLVDPLVLNFESPVPCREETCFTFDLDGDGDKEDIAGLSRGTGFLALDRNGDGRVNSGLELFGPSTGSGFAELAALDSDCNRWIDENDPGFADLRIWFQGEENGGRLVSLAEAGVGALSVSHVGTRFSLEGQAGDLLGQISANSVFLLESGEVRSLQEIDLAPGGERLAADPEAGRGPLHDALRTLSDIIRLQRRRLHILLAQQRLDAAAPRHWQRLFTAAQPPAARNSDDQAPGPGLPDSSVQDVLGSLVRGE